MVWLFGRGCTLSDLLETEDTRLLTEIGFIALSAGLESQADLIFRGIEAARPGQEAGPLGRALVHLARGEIDAAIAILRALPPSDAALSYLGLALARRGDGTEARAILQRVARTSSDTAFVDLATAALQGLPE
jgi:thioredoxin-like negative regulator of GroEL